ncbi:putative serine-threonine protein plant-type, partial [Trifolium pratense]
VAFKIQLYAGTSPKNFAIEGAKNLKATWVIIDRQMKKDEEFFLQKLSCGISRILGKTRIERLRGPIQLAVEIPCNSDHPSADSLPESLGGDVPKSPINVEGVSQIHCRLDNVEGCSTFSPNINEKKCETSTDHASMDETDINRNQIIDKIEGDKQCQDQEHNEKVSHEDDSDTTLVTNNDQTKDLHMSQTQTRNGSVSSMCYVCKTRRPNIEWQKDFTYEEIESATDGFSLKNCLSESGNPFSTFKGKLEGEVKIVVKQHEITNIQVREKMKSEVQNILKARHNNVVMLLGSSTKDRFMLIVYEYACNGSLDMYLSSERCRPLAWSERLRVAMGLCRGLKYLHDNDIIHGNIKPSNILLTHEFKALLGDFDLGKKLEPKKSFNNKSIGNSEYIAPEYLEKGKLSTKTDVYSFGVVILELITGRKATDKISGEKRLVGWAKPLLEGKKYSELVDPIISRAYEEDQLHWLVQVVSKCLKKKPKERYSMNMVVSALQGISDSEQFTEVSTSPTSDSRIVFDTNGSQVTLQGMSDSKQCDMTEDSLPVASNSIFVSDVSDSQGNKEVCPKESDCQSQKVKQIEPFSFEEENRPQILDSKNMITNHLSEFEENLKRKCNEKGISTQEVSINHMIGKDQEEKSSIQVKRGLRPVPISGILLQTQPQSSFNENLHDEHQDEIILEKSKSSACSICKSKRPKITRMKDFTYDDLLEATKGFSVENSLSESENGPTFKGLLESKMKIVVKIHQITRSQEENIFRGKFPVIDMEGKNENINRKTKVEQKKSYKDKSAKDFGYAAPEYTENGKLSAKIDVYSFGVVLLELITGRRVTDKLPGGKSLVGWAKPLLGGKKYAQLVDSKISNSYEQEQLQWLVQVTEKCLKKNPKERYSMNMVMSALQGISESDDSCLIEDSSSETSYLPNDQLVVPTIRSQGEMMVDLVSRETKRIDTNTYKEETSFKTETTTNDMIKNFKENQQNKESFHMEEKEVEKKPEDIRQKIIQDIKQMQDSCNDTGFWNENQDKTILENISKSTLCSICKSRRPNNEWQRKITYEELQAATEGFSIKYSLSEGEYGPAFKGLLDNKLKIAIKKIQVTSLQEEKEFMSEVQLLINTRHENMIMLLGQSGRLLTWRERMKIAIGVSRGLKYLHENNIIHGRVKPSNILLNHDYKPLLGDFVFRKDGRELKNSCKDKSVLNCGYTAPECKESGKLSAKADVYSFGVVLLELITGSMVSDKMHGQKCLIEWARPLLGGREYLQLMDPEISSSYEEEELAALVLITEKCLRKNLKERFTMNM